MASYKFYFKNFNSFLKKNQLIRYLPAQYILVTTAYKD